MGNKTTRGSLSTKGENNHIVTETSVVTSNRHSLSDIQTKKMFQSRQRSASITITPFSQQAEEFYNYDASKNQLLEQVKQNTNNEIIEKKEENKLQYIQLYNIDGDAFYLDVVYATIWWIPPENTDLNDIIIISHEHFDNNYRSLYYEYLDSENNRKVSWDPPYELLSNDAIIMLHDVILMNRKDIERLTNVSYDYDLTENYMIKLETFLLEKEQLAESNNELDNNIESPRDYEANEKNYSLENNEVIENKDNLVNIEVIEKIDSHTNKEQDNKTNTQLVNDKNVNIVNSNQLNDQTIHKRLNSLDSLVSKLFKSIDLSDNESNEEFNDLHEDIPDLPTLRKSLTDESIIPIDAPISKSLTRLSQTSTLPSEESNTLRNNSISKTNQRISISTNKENDNNLIIELTNSNNELSILVDELKSYISNIQSSIYNNNSIELKHINESTSNYYIITSNIIQNIELLHEENDNNKNQIEKLNNEINYLQNNLQLQQEEFQLQQVDLLKPKNQSDNQQKPPPPPPLQMKPKLQNENENEKNELIKYYENKLLSEKINNEKLNNQIEILLNDKLKDNQIDKEISSEMKLSDDNNRINQLQYQINNLLEKFNNYITPQQKSIPLSTYPSTNFSEISNNLINAQNNENIYNRRNIYLYNYLTSYPINYITNHLSNKLSSYLSIPLTQFFPLELTIYDYIQRIFSIISYSLREILIDLLLSKQMNHFEHEMLTIDKYIQVLLDHSVSIDAISESSQLKLFGFVYNSEIKSCCLYIYQWIRFINIYDSVIETGRLLPLSSLFQSTKTLLQQFLPKNGSHNADSTVGVVWSGSVGVLSEGANSGNDRQSRRLSNRKEIDFKQRSEMISLALKVLDQLENQLLFHIESKEKRMYESGWLWERPLDKEPSANFPVEIVPVFSSTSTRRGSFNNHPNQESNFTVANSRRGSFSEKPQLTVAPTSYVSTSTLITPNMSTITNLTGFTSIYQTNINFNNSNNQLIDGNINKDDTIILDSLKEKLTTSLSTKESATTKLVLRLVSIYEAVSKLIDRLDSSKVDSKTDNKINNKTILLNFLKDLSNLLESLHQAIKPNISNLSLWEELNDPTIDLSNDLSNESTYLPNNITSNQTNSTNLANNSANNLLPNPPNNLSNSQSTNLPNNLSSSMSSNLCTDWYNKHNQLLYNHKLLKHSITIIQKYQLNSIYLSNYLTNYSDIVTMHSQLQQLMNPIDSYEYIRMISSLDDLSFLSTSLFYHNMDNQCIGSLLITIGSYDFFQYSMIPFKVSNNHILKQLDMSDINLSNTKSLRYHGFPCHTLLQSNVFAIDEIIQAQYPLNELIGISFNVKQLHSAGYTVQDCKNIGVDIQDIRNNGYTDDDIISSQCYSWKELLHCGIDIQRYILLDLYHKCNGKYWKRKLNWNTNYPLNTWQGVHIDGHGHIYKLILKSNNLSGTIPNNFFLLKYLEYLDISYNQIYGNIPKNISNLKVCKDLWLNDNKLNITSTTRPMLQALLPKCCIRL